MALRATLGRPQGALYRPMERIFHAILGSHLELHVLYILVLVDRELSAGAYRPCRAYRAAGAPRLVYIYAYRPGWL